MRLLRQNKKFLYVSFVLIVSLILCEIIMRVVGKFADIDFRIYMKELRNPDRLPEGLFIGDDILNYRLNPNVQVLATTSDFSVIYKVNPKGLRDKEYSYKKSADKTRIVALGDSYTFGEGIPYSKRFADIPEEYFSNLEIINMGVPGYGLDQMLLYFYAEGVKYNPDYVIVFINRAVKERVSTGIVKNDSVVLENIPVSNPEGGELSIYLKRNDAFFKKNTYYSKSYFLSYLNYHISLFVLKKRFEIHDKLFWNKVVSDYILNKNNTDEKALLKVQKRNLLLINKINEICRQINCKLIVVGIDSNGDNSFLDKVDKDILFFDLMNDLKKIKKSDFLYFKYDRHYNRKTHQFIAEKLINILSEIKELDLLSD